MFWLTGCQSAASGTPLPNLVGMHGDKAEDALQKPDAYLAKDVAFQDVKAGETSPRTVIIKGNWKVCGQSPGAGSPSVKNMTVKLYVVKNEENCPGGSPTPSPSAAAPAAVPTAPATTAKPTPEAAPSTVAPAPTATTNPPSDTHTPPSAPAVAPTPPAPAHSPEGSCRAHTVAYCGWDRGETPEQSGETATCKDGYVSFSGDDGSGTCSGHKGVRVWFK
ncbi:PASTA domain-containing protein [Kitasatospora humi]|uniref:PASTA domain-containing protein n=1 Tax=Kitasatospora humi TaxID=2893891 RepID=UPI0027E13794|nr:PASTA domain-containing protein [Kitasatospora humi]